jgi:hypothetical protein
MSGAGESYREPFQDRVIAPDAFSVDQAVRTEEGRPTPDMMDAYRRRFGPELTEQQVHELIFLPGLSTVDVATDLSGRGVGMDVVRCNVETLGGSIELQSVPGKGTRFTLCLPIATDGQIMGESVADGLLQLRHSA